MQWQWVEIKECWMCGTFRQPPHASACHSDPARRGLIKVMAALIIITITTKEDSGTLVGHECKSVQNQGIASNVQSNCARIESGHYNPPPSPPETIVATHCKRAAAKKVRQV